MLEKIKKDVEEPFLFIHIAIRIYVQQSAWIVLVKDIFLYNNTRIH